jgi:TolB-like protein
MGLLTWGRALGGGVLAFALWGVVAAAWVLFGGGVSVSMDDLGPREPSIAVLPFDDLSPEGDQRYFVEGLSEEIITALTQIDNLKVSARTSAFAFRDSDLDVRTIADSLGVANVLEGSVRKNGNQIRITAQLIEAETGFQIWSETFNRELTDIFAIQDAIARAIGGGLMLPLGLDSGESLVSTATEDMDAYELYLKARAAIGRRANPADVDSVLRFYERALAADPEYAMAHAGAAEAWAIRPNYGGDLSSDLARAEQSARTALSLDPSLVRAQLVLANVHRDRWEWDEAEKAYEIALRGLADDPEAHHEYGEFLNDVGRCSEAVTEQRRALDADPLSGVFHYFLSHALLCDGQMDEGIVAARRAAELGFGLGRRVLTFALLEAGRVDEAVEFAPRGRANEWYGAVAEAIRDGSRPPPAPEAGFDQAEIAWAFALLGYREEALRYTEERLAPGAGGPTFRVWMPAIQQLLGDDPRYQAALEGAGIGR